MCKEVSDSMHVKHQIEIMATETAMLTIKTAVRGKKMAPLVSDNWCRNNQRSAQVY